MGLVRKLHAGKKSAVASDGEQLQPTFACWDCAIVNIVRTTHDAGEKSPSLHWLARQCGAEVTEWNDDKTFSNINTPDDRADLENC